MNSILFSCGRNGNSSYDEAEEFDQLVFAYDSYHHGYHL
jgi:hypothetical protein